MQWIFLIAIGFICIAYPIMLFILVCYMPFYAILVFLAWLTICITSIAYSKSEKVFEKLSVSIIASIIFGIFLGVVVSSGETELLFDEDEVGALFAFVLSPFLSLPAIYLVGNKLQTKVIAKENEKRRELLSECKKELHKQLNIKSTIIKVIDEYYLTTENTLDLIRLIDNLHTKESNDIESSYINAENKRFLDCRQSLLLKIDTSERENFPKGYEDIDLYYYGIQNEVKNIKSQLKNIEKFNFKDLTKIRKSL